MSGAARPGRVLVLAYYFPPLGGSGVQRVASLVRHLPVLGWQPTVIAARPSSYLAFDTGLADDVAAAGVTVVRTASLDPTRAGVAPTTPGGRRSGWLAALTRWAFVPDNKVGWTPFALRAADAAHREAPFDVVMASAPPYTSLLLAARLARRWARPLVLDLRDDWVDNPRHVYPTALHRRLHERLERIAFARASAILTISDAMRDNVVRRHPGLAARVHVVPQGFEPEDIAPIADPEPTSDTPFRIVYAGMFYDVQRPDTFLDGLAAFVASNPLVPVVADFYGHVPPTMAARVDALGLQDRVRVHGYIPHHELMPRLADASVLWMTIGHRPGAASISTGKLYEYVGTRRPILGLVPVDGTAADTLRAYGRGWVVDPDDSAGVATALGELHARWRSGTLPAASEALIRQHDRRRIAADVARRILDPCRA